MIKNKGRVDMIDLINGILGSLVSITAGCFLYRAWEAMLIGAVGAILTCLTMPLFDRWAVDDPVGASSVHGVCGIWGKFFLLNCNFSRMEQFEFSHLPQPFCRSYCCGLIC